jgi:hypothetical protein
VELVLDSSLSIRYGVNRVNPVLEIDDMLPDVSDENKTPGLTLFRFTLSPCLSIVVWRCNVVFCARDPDAAWTGAVLVHSPELPQFSIRSSTPNVPGAGLHSNESHDARTNAGVSIFTVPVLLSQRIKSTSTFCALSDLSHYQPV